MGVVTPAPLALRTALRSVAGPHRATNQDSAGACADYAFVADGVGGHAGGDVASRAVALVVTERLADLDVRALAEEELRDVVGVANDAIARHGRNPELAGLATTFTGLFCTGDAVRVAHIGDSRGYLVRDGAGSRVTHDDSYVQLLVDTGAIDPDEAWLHPARNLLLQSLGGTADDAAHVSVLRRDAQVGDRWLLCSDGLTDYVAEADVLEVLSGAPDVESAAERLVAAALEADARDNVTVAVCDVVAGDEGDDAPRLVGAAGYGAAGQPTNTQNGCPSGSA